MRRNHMQAVKDFQYLEGIAPLDDAVAIMDEVFDLMFNPTKKRAVKMIESAIQLWFQEHGQLEGSKPILKKWNLI